MNRIISILLLLLLSVQFFFKAGVAGYYFANKNYIAKVLCINKDNQEMHCDGKCYLKQKMKAADENTPQASVSIKYEPVEFITAPFIFISGLCIERDSPSLMIYSSHYYFTYSRAVFQPPCTLA